VEELTRVRKSIDDLSCVIKQSANAVIESNKSEDKNE